MTKKITDMTKLSPEVILGGSLLLGASEYIEFVEQVGQRELVNSTKLPTSAPGCTREILTRAGVIFGEVDPEDPLFQNATLPKGWSKKETSHAMHSSLIDDKGRKRADIFYKAAYYDRRADIRTCRRFGIQNEYDDEKKLKRSLIWDCEKKIVFTSEWFPQADYIERDNGSVWVDASTDAVLAWLKEHLPNWADDGAYWEEP